MAARPYAEKMARSDRQPGGRTEGQSERAEAACGHRQGRHASADRGDVGSRLVRRLQHQHRPAGQTEDRGAHGRRQEGPDPVRRPQGARPAQAPIWPLDRRYRRIHRRQAHRLRQRAGHRQARAGDVRRRRVRRRDHHLFPLQVGHDPDPDGAAIDPGSDRGRRRRRRPDGLRIRAGRTGNPGRPVCRATSTCRFSAPCWKMSPANSAPR